MIVEGLGILILPVQRGPEDSQKLLQWLMRDVPLKFCCSHVAFTLPALWPEAGPVPADSSRGSPVLPCTVAETQPNLGVSNFESGWK